MTIWQNEPIHRSTASLLIQDRTLPESIEPEAGAVEDFALAHVQNRRDRILRPDDEQRITTRLTQATITANDQEQLPIVSIAFDISVEGDDALVVDRAAAELIERYFEDDARAAILPIVPAEELEAAQLEADEAAAAAAALEAELEEFKWNNAAALPELYELNVEAMNRAERERDDLDRKVSELEARRVELDRGLRDMQRGADAFRSGNDAVLTSDGLVALQSRWAVLRGRYGNDSPEAIALGGEINELQAEAQARLDTAQAELQRTVADLTELERTLQIDHPDVVRLAHAVSALELRVADLTITGLTAGERRYIESLARERVEIDDRLEELGGLQASLRESMADYEARATDTPRVEQQYLAIQEDLGAARERQEATAARSEALATRLAESSRQQPGRLSLVRQSGAQQLLLTRPESIVALGIVAALITVLVAVGFVERVDRRILGATDIDEIQGNRLLFEIPSITAASPPRSAALGS